MCGFCGVVSYAAAPTTPAQIEKMTATMTHRGPDDAGVHLLAGGRVALGHRRLSIVDLSAAGHQPMSNEDGTVWIVYNGEVYNHEALRAELEAAGHRYRSRTDTETLLHAYEQWGIDFLHRLEGMFAFALYDARADKLWLVRDRIGVKPCYYTLQGGRLLFASEIKAILAHDAITPAMDELSAFHYLTFITTPAPRTMFKGIDKLPPGHCLELDGRGESRLHRWYDVLDAQPFVPVTDEREATATIVELLRESIRKRMMADVPYGVFLSGGVDSSTNVALMSQCTDRPVRTFTVGFAADEAFNEMQYARQIAQRFGTDHHEVLIDEKDLENFMPDLIFHQDEPIADWVCVPLYYVSKLLRDSGTIVVQVGEGADEIFCGYPGYMEFLRSYRRYYSPYMKLPGAMRRAAHGVWRGLGLDGRGPDIVGEALRLGAENQELFWGGSIMYKGWRKNQILAAPERFAGHDSYTLVLEQLDRFDGLRPGADILDRMIYLELKIRLAELLLMRVDKITMATSIEARVPFLDHKLVEYALRIPRALKIKNDVSKYILKEAVRDLLPAEIVDRPKQGFGVPGTRWFRNKLLPFAREAIMHSRLRERNLIDYSFVDTMFEKYTSKQADYSIFLWTLINLSKWYDFWVAKDRS